MTDTGDAALAPPRTVRLQRTERGLELYYPPLRTPEVAFPLALFGLIAAALPLAGAAALLPRALADTAGLLTTVLVAAFVAPFAAFGVVVVVQALYMVSNSLSVCIDARGIATRRRLLGITVRMRHMMRGEVGAVEALIAARHQSYFGREPIYALVALDASRRQRVVVAESLRGAALMERVKKLIEDELSTRSPASATIGA